MKSTSCMLLIAISMFDMGCSSPKITGSAIITTMQASSLEPLGRYIINPRQHLELIGSAAHFGFTFNGSACQIFASLPQGQVHNYLQYTVDGLYGKKLRVEGNSNQPIVISPPGDGTHTIWVFKNTEAATGPIIIEKIVGNNLKALPIPVAPLIEFIGNSITCGAAADTSETPCGSGVYHDQHNAYFAYGPRVARALAANYVVSCVSGIGVYRNWNSDGPAMPEVYGNTSLNTNATQKWDFRKRRPDIVSIALGTNDFSSGDGKKLRLLLDSSLFVDSHIRFIESIRNNYPGTRIAVLGSPLVHGKNSIMLQNCLKAVKRAIDLLHKEDKPLALFFFQAMQGKGCTGHPDVQDHAVMANQLIPFFKKLLE